MKENENKEDDILVRKVIDVILSANLTIFRIDQLKHQNQFWLKELKNYGNLFLNRLMKIETQFDILADQESTIKTYEYFDDFMREIHPLDLEEMIDMTEILKAYKKQKNKMLGTARRINK